MTTKEPVKIIAEPDEFDVWLDREIDKSERQLAVAIRHDGNAEFWRGFVLALRRVKQELGD